MLNWHWVPELPELAPGPTSLTPGETTTAPVDQQPAAEAETSAGRVELLRED